MKITLRIILALAYVALGYLICKITVEPQVVYTNKLLEDPPINLDYAYDRMLSARDSHQKLLDYPANMNDWTGDEEWNQEWVEVYDDMIRLINWLREAE